MTLNKYKLSDLYEIGSGIGSSKEQAGHGSPFLSFSTVFNSTFLPETLTDWMDTNDREQIKYSVLKDDVFLTRTSETLDELGMSSVALNDHPNATFSGFLKRLRPKPGVIGKKVDSKYIAFYLRSQLFRTAINNKATMTLRASLNENIINDLDVYLPSIESQQQIGEYLYTIESLVKNNQKQILEFEKMAQLIYSYWFLQFDFPDENGKPYWSSGGKMVWNEELKREIPEGWKCSKITSIGKTVGGGTPSTKHEDYYVQPQGGIGWATPKDLADDRNLFFSHGARDITEKGLNGSSAVLVPKGTVLMTSRAPIGYLAIAAETVATNQGFKSIVPNDQVLTEWIYHTLKSLIPSLKRRGAGSTFSEVSKKDVEETDILLPPLTRIAEFHKIAKPIYDQILDLEKQISELTKLRDFLLPLLMNGQITFKEEAETTSQTV